MMDTIADILLIAGALGAGLYCFVLSRRLSRFNDLERGVGGAVAVLSAQVDDLTRTLQAARTAASTSTDSLDQLTRRAETVSRRLELLVAAMHDLPPQPTATGEDAPAPSGEPATAMPPAEEVPPPPGPVFRRHPVATGAPA